MKKIFAMTVSLAFAVAVSAQNIKGTFAIKNVQTGLLLRVKDANGANGTPLVSYTPVEWKCMTWDFQSHGNNVYQLKNMFTGKTFQPTTDSVADGTALYQQPVKAEASGQQYEFIVVERNVYLIRLKGTALYLTPSDDGGVNSAVVLSQKIEAKIQQWTLYEQHPTL